MKKPSLFFALLLTLQINSQISLQGYDPGMCLSTFTNNYTYSNYGSGGHSYGFKIYKNGQQVYDMTGNLYPEKCFGLVFINDSTGFLIKYGNPGMEVLKTTNYGANWIDQGGNYGAFLLGFYPINEKFGYLITQNGDKISVTRLPGSGKVTLLIDNAPSGSDISVSDSLIKDTYCNVATLNILLKAGSTSFTYHINFSKAIVGINDLNDEAKTTSLYPNPAATFFSVENLSDNASVSLLSISGQPIKDYSPEEVSAKTFLLTDIKNGIYFVKISDSGKTAYSKIVIGASN